MAASTVVEQHFQLGSIRKITFAVVFNTGDATFDDYTLTSVFEGKLLSLQTNPGATQPTDNYDITIEDAGGHDVLEGVGTNRDTLNTEKANIVFTGTGTTGVVDDTDVLTLKISGNSVNSAIVDITLMYSLGA